MQGTNIKNLLDFLSNGHEVLFSYEGNTYSIEPDNDDLTIWRYAFEKSNDRKAAMENLSGKSNIMLL